MDHKWSRPYMPLYFCDAFVLFNINAYVLVQRHFVYNWCLCTLYIGIFIKQFLLTLFHIHGYWISGHCTRSKGNQSEGIVLGTKASNQKELYLVQRYFKGTKAYQPFFLGKNTFRRRKKYLLNHRDNQAQMNISWMYYSKAFIQTL